MGAEASGMWLLGAMDRLWFHQIILFSENSLLLSPLASVITFSQVESSQESDDHVKEITTHEVEERPCRLINLVSNKTRCHSSSPISAKKQSRNHLGNADYSVRRLQKSTSCKSVGDLELEEVKGFMDLGFIFKKENLSNRMTRLIPGLQRINDDAYKTNQQDSQANVEDEDEGRKGVLRPYLSEAWLIKRPDYPLESLRIPRFCSASDMKKHLKCWARTVASAIQQ